MDQKNINENVSLSGSSNSFMKIGHGLLSVVKGFTSYGSVNRVEVQDNVIMEGSPSGRHVGNVIPLYRSPVRPFNFDGDL